MKKRQYVQDKEPKLEDQRKTLVEMVTDLSFLALLGDFITEKLTPS